MPIIERKGTQHFFSSQALKDRVSNLSKKLEEANVTYDQLKECLSPHDLKRLCQRLWLITQRQGDLEHHLLLQILWLEDHLETQQSFILQHGRFMTWANDLIQRYNLCLLSIITFVIKFIVKLIVQHSTT